MSGSVTVDPSGKCDCIGCSTSSSSPRYACLAVGVGPAASAIFSRSGVDLREHESQYLKWRRSLTSCAPLHDRVVRRREHKSRAWCDPPYVWTPMHLMSLLALHTLAAGFAERRPEEPPSTRASESDSSGSGTRALLQQRERERPSAPTHAEPNQLHLRHAICRARVPVRAQSAMV